MKKQVCDVSFDRLGLKTGPICRTCRYHRKEGQEYPSARLYPAGCCPHLYKAAYPFALALLYGSTFDGRRKITFSCPSAGTKLKAEAASEPLYPLPVRLLKRTAIRMLQILNVPAEFPENQVTIRVVSVKGKCPVGLGKGDSFRFNLFDRQELCPASFYNLYPALVNAATGKKIPANLSKVHCPDPFGVYYETPGTGIKCIDYFRPSYSGRHKISYGILPSGMCPLAFYSAIPYITAYFSGGSFEWVKPGECVQVQCPKHDGIKMDIRRSGKKVTVLVNTVLGKCPKGHKQGASFAFDSTGSLSVLQSLASLVPYEKDRQNGRKQYCAPDGAVYEKK